MKTFGLIGYPLEHSFSQRYFTDKFNEEGTQARYLNFAIKNIHEFPELLKHHPYLSGLNVTIPYKQAVMDYLDDIDPAAQEIGAVNVIKITWEGTKPFLKGYNSDVIGFYRSLAPLLRPIHHKALILGTGGASKAVANGLKQMGLLYRFVSRNPSHPSQVAYEGLTPEILSEYKVIVNTTPLGMTPKINACPPIPYQAITPDHLIYDVVYNPETTLFMQKSAEQGAVIKNGIEMLHIQAEVAWEIWNGEKG